MTLKPGPTNWPKWQTMGPTAIPHCGSTQFDVSTDSAAATIVESQNRLIRAAISEARVIQICENNNTKQQKLLVVFVPLVIKSPSEKERESDGRRREEAPDDAEPIRRSIRRGRRRD